MVQAESQRGHNSDQIPVIDVTVTSANFSGQLVLMRSSTLEFSPVELKRVGLVTNCVRLKSVNRSANCRPAESFSFFSFHELCLQVGIEVADEKNKALRVFKFVREIVRFSRKERRCSDTSLVAGNTAPSSILSRTKRVL